MALAGCLVLSAGTPAGVWAMGRTPAPAPRPVNAGEEWRLQFEQGKRWFHQRDFAKAVAVLEPLAQQHADDPWLELYTRVARKRLQQLQHPAEETVATSTPAVLRMMGLPPVMIRPTEHLPVPPPAPPPPPPTPSTPPVSTAARPTPGAAVTTPASQQPSGALAGGASAGAARGAAPVTAPPAQREVPEPAVPYPQEIPLPKPTALKTGPAAELPVQAHADVIEFSPELQRVIGRGHVRVTHQDLLLTCDRVVVFTQSRDALAEGHVRLTGPDGVLTGETVYYNFATKKGDILHGGGEFFPWYLRGLQLQKTAEHTIRAHRAYLTTCDLDPPHYRLETQDATVYLGDRMIAHNVVFYIGRMPLWYFPRMTHSLRENRLKWSFYPGKRKPWGWFLLSKYRYEINGNAKGLLHWDWRNHYGHGQGLDFKYATKYLGYGLLQTYYNKLPDRTKRTKELVLPDKTVLGPETVKGAAHDRFRISLRHRWDADPTTNLLLEFHKFRDEDFLKDFLYREIYQLDATPESYLSFTSAQPGYTFSTLIKKRVNQFQTVTESEPEVKLDVREQRVQDTRLFYSGTVTAGNYNQKTAHKEADTDVGRLDVFNQFKYAMKLFRFYNVTPNIGVRQTYYTKDKQGGSERPDGERNFLRGVLSSGVDVSTKIYRLFDVQTNLWGLNIRQLRHIITPTLSYAYTRKPTVTPLDLAHIDGIDSIDRSNAVTIGLENKLQTKQLIKGQLQKVDMVRFLLSAPYNFNKFDSSASARLGNITADLEVQPQPWLRVESDATYDHLLQDVTLWNFDIAASGGEALISPSNDQTATTRSLIASTIRDSSLEEIAHQRRPRWTVEVGHRYQREVRSEMTAHVQFQPHAKWWFDIFGRFVYKDVAGSEKRINSAREYQFIITRDLHDWLLEITVGEDRDLGGIFLVSLVLKVFPDSPVSLDDSYHRPKQGSQSSAFYGGTAYYKAPVLTTTGPQ